MTPLTNVHKLPYLKPKVTEDGTKTHLQVRFSNLALTRVEDHFGKSITEIVDEVAKSEKPLSIKDTLAILRIGMQDIDESKDISLRDASNEMDLIGYMQSMKHCFEAFTDALGAGRLTEAVQEGNAGGEASKS